ncbi:hypothetical protein SKAU_G00303590 [Synaphobranchus kaupii]|uniref:Uncharacterized protein n=1 Tax=Synaphobranchus kaupii TaxID=118154 RepID=A0A9Q1INJ2_SYNKA|nr:hypothetical protein SKAU_G00303590 [Synaphobranchus kaupii]
MQQALRATSYTSRLLLRGTADGEGSVAGRGALAIAPGLSRQHSLTLQRRTLAIGRVREEDGMKGRGGSYSCMDGGRTAGAKGKGQRELNGRKIMFYRLEVAAETTRIDKAIRERLVALNIFAGVCSAFIHECYSVRSPAVSLEEFKMATEGRLRRVLTRWHS